jgi:hypothetical protein
MSLGAPELDAATADAIAGEIGRASKHALPLGAPCPNCGTPLQGPWCHACGQKGEAYQRSIWHLIGEAFEGLTHVDGRVWKTLPRLAVRPGQLTRDYLDGHRASQIPPFRIFLVMLLLVFFAGGLNFSATNEHFKFKSINDPEVQAQMTPEQRAQVAEALGAVPGKSRSADNFRLDLSRNAATNAFWTARAKKVLTDPEAFMLALEQWGHRFAILTLPIAALMLSVLFAFKRNVYVFDHLIFSMHSLSFQGLLVSACFVAGIWAGWAWQALWLAPVHLFAHMRGTYGTSVVGTLVRMALLFFGSCVALGFLVAGLVLVGMATMH